MDTPADIIWGHFATTAPLTISSDGTFSGGGAIIGCSCGVPVDGGEAFLAHRESFR